MTATSVPASRPRALPFDVRRVLVVAAVVALVDGLYVVGVFDWSMGATTAPRIFQGIALALVGRELALGGGWWTALLGLAMHVGVALSWTLVWALLYGGSARVRALVRTVPRALVAGVLYGVGVHLAMQLAILPLTHARVSPMLSRGALLVLLAHVTVIGPPIVLLQRRASTD